MSVRTDKALLAYTLLRDKAESGTRFSERELASVTGWKPSTVHTYVTKQWQPFLLPSGGDTYRVRPTFIRFTKAQFLSRFTQKRAGATRYSRTMYRAVVAYEFLLPLTRETELRNALDWLFYRDSLSLRVSEVATDRFRGVLPEGVEDEVQLKAWMLEEAERRFGGYSIVHYQGRFRASDLTTWEDSAKFPTMGERYLIDETTASVRFVIPCLDSGTSFGQGSPKHPTDLDAAVIAREVALIRLLFFELFVEVVVESVTGEDAIWLIETTPVGQRLYVWNALA